MKRILVQSPAFIRSARRILKKEPHLAGDVKTTLEMLSENAFHPQLRSHKLKDKLEPAWACSAGYKLRIIFEFVKHEGHDAILLEAIGTHDEVY